jgi:mevalonate kinase
LFGEHAVVYGRSAVAASISDLRVQVDARITCNEDVLRIILQDLPNDIDGKPLEYSTRLSRLDSLLGGLSGKRHYLKVSFPSGEMNIVLSRCYFGSRKGQYGQPCTLPTVG